MEQPIIRLGGSGLLTPPEVLSRLRINLRTLYRLLSTGELPAVRVGRQWRVRPGDLESWLKQREVAGKFRQARDSGAET